MFSIQMSEQVQMKTHQYTVNPIRTEFIHLTWGIFIFTCNILNKNIEIWLVKMRKYRPPNLACQIQKLLGRKKCENFAEILTLKVSKNLGTQTES